MTRRRVAPLAAAVVLAFGHMGEPANRLAQESSPYLLQHAGNPVDWYPWGDEAFEKAKREGKPVFLSIGYSTCHWCHVMERESFENTEIAALMNRDFVSIKVDREERPDIDNVYMTACQLLTRSGGWPLTAVLTPDGLPFFAGTYFPPGDAHGRAGMRTLLPRIAEYWKSHRAEAESQAKEVEAAVRGAIASPPKEHAAPLDAAFSASVAEELARRFDPEHGGFSQAPKFPPHGALEFLAAREDGRSVAMLRRTLDAMQDGGVFDQVGGGFHRYSVDAEWFVPHFEKMLYDNAQLLSAYAAASRRFGDAGYGDTARAIAGWLERDMKTAEGAYASGLDADSEGVEGKYYLWTAAEVDAALGPREAPLWREAFGISERGNTPAEFAEGRGKNLPRRVGSDAALAKKHGGDPGGIRRRLEADARRLEEVRARRVPPARDDKVLTSWNALAVSALARASRDLREPRLAADARRVADFLLAAH
ncbi:MAG TPA: thioredoxin domain-containing protein, partial [Thermoanaerobaculia bacterium]|nr:thioredoxin domain-containing protein [Thermoanaerobaculia bacterium]